MTAAAKIPEPASTDLVVFEKLTPVAVFAPGGVAAIDAERKRVADENTRVAAETAKREADKKHRAKINNEALTAIVALGVETELAKAIIAAIARGEVPHTKMVY